MEERLREKQALSEIIRIGLNRAQDLELIRQIASTTLESRALARQVTAECSLREQWRCAREAAVLQQVEGLTFAAAEEDLGQILTHRAHSLQTLLDTSPQRSPLLRRTPLDAPLRHSSVSVRAPCAEDVSPYQSQRRSRSQLLVRNAPASPGKGRGNFSLKEADGQDENTAHCSASPLLLTSRNPQVLALAQMHRTLLYGLKRHAACAGESAAHTALQEHVRAAQAHFAASLADVTETLADVSPSRPKSKLAAAAFAFGDLGLPARLAARLVDLRRRQAARTIQQSVRKWLGVRKGKGEKEEFFRRQDSFQRNRAARRIQFAFRTEWLPQRARLAIVRSARLTVSAGKIQRAFRCFLRRRRVTLKSAERGAARTITLSRWKAERIGELLKQRADFEGLESEDERSRWRAAVRVQSALRRVWAKRDARRRRWAVGVLQKWARGWGVRRDTWWHRAVWGMRERRRETARVKARKQATAQSWTAAERALTRLAVLQADVRRARDAIEREKAGFAAQWARWVEGLSRSALARPLPRGWLLQRGPKTGVECYVNTRTAESQAVHPAIVGLLAAIKEQKLRGEEELKARVVALEAQLVPLEEAAEAERETVRSMEKLRNACCL